MVLGSAQCPPCSRAHQKRADGQECQDQPGNLDVAERHPGRIGRQRREGLPAVEHAEPDLGDMLGELGDDDQRQNGRCEPATG